MATTWDGGLTTWDAGVTYWDEAGEVIVYGSLDGLTRPRSESLERPPQISNGTRRNIQTSSR